MGILAPLHYNYLISVLNVNSRYYISQISTIAVENLLSEVVWAPVILRRTRLFYTYFLQGRPAFAGVHCLIDRLKLTLLLLNRQINCKRRTPSLTIQVGRFSSSDNDIRIQIETGVTLVMINLFKRYGNLCFH